jgi:hypothetical protein
MRPPNIGRFTGWLTRNRNHDGELVARQPPASAASRRDAHRSLIRHGLTRDDGW